MSKAPKTAGAKGDLLLPPDLMSRLERLSLASRRPVQGTSGHRRSRRSGHSVEFNDYRPYGAGDDPRYIDWNIYSRSDRLYVKLFVDDEDLSLHLLVDASASMRWGTPSKLDWASRLAAALGFIGLNGQERVGLTLVRDASLDGTPPARGRSRIARIIQRLTGAAGEGGTSLDEALASYASRQKSGGIAVLVSDLLDPRGHEAGLRALLERRMEVHVVHVLAPDELDPSLRGELAGDIRLTDDETGETRILTVDAETLAAYRERLAGFLDAAEQFCRERGITYQRASSDSPVDDLLFGALRGKLLA